MFLVKSGALESISEDGTKILEIFPKGHSFGALSLIKLGNETARRELMVRSVGYSEVYILKQESVLDILKDYPEEKKRLMLKGLFLKFKFL